MAQQGQRLIRVLIVDDEPAVRDAYREILTENDVTREIAAFRELRSKLFSKSPGEAAAVRAASRSAQFEVVFCDQAEAAVAAVQQSRQQGRPFAVVFLDMRMPPGRDGAWAAARIRESDPEIEIVVCTAYSDADPGEMGGVVPPEDKLSYLQKPFHPHEVRQMALALGSKWRAERRIVKLAYFDTLTGLPNREQARKRLLGAVEAARDHARMLAVLYLDLDNFKRVNDTLGHAVGDQLLCVVAERLRTALLRGVTETGEPLGARPGDLARLGGDEFLLMLPNLKSPADAAATAERVIRTLREPMQFERNSLVVTPSVGIAIYPRDGGDGETLLRNADLAMYFAKRKAPGTHAFYDATMNATALHRFTMEERLRGALARNEFSLDYQPQFDVRSGTLSGMEALLRWTDEQLGAVPASEFVPIAEDTGLIVPIGEWALRTACRQAKAWNDAGLPIGKIAVNVAGSQFSLAEFPARVAAILRETALDPSMLELEITESVIMGDEKWAESALGELKRLGVWIAIDDFGTGYSSLGRLRRFPVDRLKIDQSFVASINEGSNEGGKEGSNDRAIAAAIIAISRSLNIHVTAEGVESFPQLTFLQEHDCDDAQGFLLSKAIPAKEAGELLRKVGEVRDASRTQKLKALMR